MQQKTAVKPLATEMRTIDRIVPYARDGAGPRMVAAIREFGFKSPLLVLSTGELTDGHLTLKAAKKLNLDKVAVLACDEWTPAQVRAFRLLINRSAIWADWDKQLLVLDSEVDGGIRAPILVPGGRSGVAGLFAGVRVIQLDGVRL